MRTIRTIKRADDMPMFGKVLRVKKHVYQVVIKFVKSHRIYHAENVHAANPKLVKQFFEREYPTLTWGKPKAPKVPKPRVTRASKSTPRKRANPKGKKGIK